MKAERPSLRMEPFLGTLPAYEKLQQIPKKFVAFTSIYRTDTAAPSLAVFLLLLYPASQFTVRF